MVGFSRVAAGARTNEGRARQCGSTGSRRCRVTVGATQKPRPRNIAGEETTSAGDDDCGGGGGGAATRRPGLASRRCAVVCVLRVECRADAQCCGEGWWRLQRIDRGQASRRRQAVWTQLPRSLAVHMCAVEAAWSPGCAGTQAEVSS